jgi:hypothetical protein
MQDSDNKCEWLFPETPRYYLHQTNAGKWRIIDRYPDSVEGEEHTSRSGAIRAFYKLIGRPIPEGTSLPSFKGSNYQGIG